MCLASEARQVPVLMASVLPVVQVVGTSAADALADGDGVVTLMPRSP
jgi:hypothetical protein